MGGDSTLGDPAVERALAEGSDALQEGRWDDARAIFEDAARSGHPDAIDGLGRALWWTGETEAAIAARTRAYRAYRRAGRLDDAVRVAVWLALEYGAVPGREHLANGWISRAESLAPAGSPASAWVSLARSVMETDPVRMAAHAEAALQQARTFDEPDLEIRALARSGLGLALSGRTAEGMARLDEAMAAASAGEADPEVFAEACCDMVTACEATLDGRRLEQWGQVAERFLRLNSHPRLLSFCGACCASVLAARGDLEGAQHWLRWTIDRLDRSGHHARCVDPKAKLAEIRVAQGRFEEADALLEGIRGRPEALRAAVALHVARGELGAAASLLHRRLARVGHDSPAAIPILSQLVPIHLARRDIDGAAESARRLEALAAETSLDRHFAEAEVGLGRVASAEGHHTAAVAAFTSAVERYERARMTVEAARARLLLAEALADEDPETAMVEARSASAVLDKAGLTAEADQADALVRSLGGRGRVGPKVMGLLTKREREVLELVVEGLTNAEIADRLYISTKTAANHVSNILVKLGVRTRTEAATVALRLRSESVG